MISDNNRFILGSRRLKEFAAHLETQAAQSASQKSNTHNVYFQSTLPFFYCKLERNKFLV